MPLSPPLVREPRKGKYSVLFKQHSRTRIRERGDQLCRKKSQPHQRPWKKIRRLKTTFYSITACVCISPQTTFNSTILINCMTAAKGEMKLSPLLLGCYSDQKQHLFTSDLHQIIQEECCIIKKVFLSQYRMTGIKYFPLLFCHVTLFSIAYWPIHILCPVKIVIFSLTYFCLGAWLGILEKKYGGLYL